MHTLRIIQTDQESVLMVEDGANLRQILLDAGISPYTAVTKRANCGGNGLCATCGVWIEYNEPIPTHWHDKLASQFGYPRLSCQITVHTDMTIRLVDKLIWGARKKAYARKLTSFVTKP